MWLVTLNTLNKTDFNLGLISMQVGISNEIEIRK